jgi:hypothetical protein
VEEPVLDHLREEHERHDADGVEQH